MEKYSKLIGSVLGSLAAYGVTKGIVPAELATEPMVLAVTTLVVGAFTFLFPANKTS